MKIAIVGATGNVGRIIVSLLEARDNISYEDIILSASLKSSGQSMKFKGNDLPICDTDSLDFTNIDIALFAVSGSVSKEYAKKAKEAGVVVIDNSSFWRMDRDVSLIIPEINGNSLSSDVLHRGCIISNPNCIAIPLSVVLSKLLGDDAVSNVYVASYQSVSGAGYRAIEEMQNQLQGISDSVDVIGSRIAFDLVPKIGDFLPDGSTQEEFKVMEETQKILGSKLNIMSHCIRVPTWQGHAIALTVQFNNEVCLDDVIRSLREVDTIVISGDNGGISSPYATSTAAISDAGAAGMSAPMSAAVMSAAGGAGSSSAGTSSSGSAVSASAAGAASTSAAVGGAAHSFAFSGESSGATNTDAGASATRTSAGLPQYFTLSDAIASDKVYVSRLRQFDQKNVGMWVVSDNLYKGAASNAVAILDKVIELL